VQDTLSSICTTSFECRMTIIHDLQYVDSSVCGQWTVLLRRTLSSLDRTAFCPIFKPSTSRIGRGMANREFLHITLRGDGMCSGLTWLPAGSCTEVDPTNQDTLSIRSFKSRLKCHSTRTRTSERGNSVKYSTCIITLAAWHFVTAKLRVTM
jgi:hypothetical protein